MPLAPAATETAASVEPTPVASTCQRACSQKATYASMVKPPANASSAKRAHSRRTTARLCELITSLLNGEPNLRLGMMGGGIAEVKAHPYFAPVGWIALEEQKALAPWVPEVKSIDDVSSFNMDQESEWEPQEAAAGEEYDHSWCAGF